VQDGTHVYTVSRINFASFENNPNGVSASLLLDLSVDASKSQSVTRRVGAGVNISFSGQAKVYVQITHGKEMVDINYVGLEWTRPLTHRINTWTNARLLRGVVLSKAQQAAMAAVPGAKQRIKATINQELRNGIAQQKAAFRQYFIEIARSMRDVPGAVPKLASDRAGAYFQHHIKFKNPSLIQNPPHTPPEADSGLLFHQETF